MTLDPVTEKPFLLCLDDEAHNLDALERIFRKKYTVLKATDGQSALQLLASHPIVPIIISDQRMPEMSGVEFLERTINTHPDSVRILLTGYTDIESVIESVNKAQIYRYLTKPWDTTDLSNTVDQANEKFNLKKELRIKNEELTKALIELQQMDKAKSQFMILINHELKTPLTTILSFVAILKETLLSEEQSLFVDRINKSSEKLKKIVDDVLLVLRGELGTLTKNISQVQISDLIKNCPDEIKNNVKLKSQSITENLSLKEIKSDSQLLGTAFNRALHNATKFGTAHSEILIQSETNNNKNIISITNHGPKISEDVLNKIFQPFQLDENIMNHSVGMGLGLTICQTITKTLGGNLKIINLDDGVQVQFIFENRH